jgi:hypothetical protein
MREPAAEILSVAKDLARFSGGEGGIRTPDRAFKPYNGLANRRLKPLGHLSGGSAQFTTHQATDVLNREAGGMTLIAVAHSALALDCRFHGALLSLRQVRT